jgi:hypothetical protein
MTKTSGHELAARYPDEVWRTQYLALVDVVSLLRHCIIPDSFKIPDNLNSAIVLTDYGSRIQTELITKHKVPTKEARMMCFLEIAHDEPMVDLEKTKLAKIIEEISTLLQKGIIRYPFIYGGHLYRRAAELFPDLRSQLNSSETVELLEGLPCGVYQVGDTVVGPLGVLKSEEMRWLPPTLRVPLQHCSDLTCRHVHGTTLSTDYDASINQNLPKMAKVLADTTVARGAWTDFTGLLVEERHHPFDDFDMVGIPGALGDCLTNDELDLVSNQLGFPSSQEVVAPASNVDQAQTRAKLLQQIWVKTDEEIARVVDFLIAAGKIEISGNEVRRPPLIDLSVGSLGLRTQFGRHGVRLKPGTSDVPLFRLRRLVTQLYDLNDDRDRRELRWQLRMVDYATTEDRLEEYLRTTPPSVSIAKLVLARRGSVERALKELRIDDAGIPLGDAGPSGEDAALIEKLLWKLGFEQDLQASPSSDFWGKYYEARQAVRDTGASAAADLKRLREGVRELFISLEGLLADCIDFSWWALTTDHLSATKAFTYTQSQGIDAWDVLLSHAATVSELKGIRMGDRDKRTLYPLGQAFRVLASLLRFELRNEATYLRTTDSIPKWARQASLERFDFNHTVPFLDLARDAQEGILQGLEELSRLLKTGNVHGVRNQVSHFQRSTSNLEEVERALIASRSAVECLETLGFVRAEYRARRTERDEWDRSVVMMRSFDGDEVTLLSPSREGYVGLPGLRSTQYLVRSAVFASPGEILRFRVGNDSPFSAMWSDFPRPRIRRPGVLEPGREAASDVARASHGVLPQA